MTQAYDRPPMPLLGNSNMRSSTGGRTSITLAPYASARIAEWSSEENEAQELELLAYPLGPTEGSTFAADPDLPIKVWLQLVHAVGASGGASGLSLETRLVLPSNGIRYRFRAKAATLAAVGGWNADVNIAMAAAIYPCAGDTGAECGMDTVPRDSNALLIPKGARAFRCSPGMSEPLAVLQFFDMTSTLIASFVANMVNDWLDIPRGAYSFSNPSAWPGSGSRILYGTTVYFRT